jgi:CheY-like chemotaxis protein
VSKRKLLLADDSETVQKVVNLTFELEGIEVVTFGDGDSAMSQFSAVAPDVVLADVHMPGLDGYQICQNIKTNEATKNTPVILLVGSFEPFDEQRAMQVGADDYLTKPFQSIRQLVSKVNELLAPKTENNQNEIDEIHFNDTLEMKKNDFPETEFSDTDFGDSAMDNEMIQTNQVGSVPMDETAKYLTPNNQFDEDDGLGKTQPLSAKDWQDIYSQEKKSEETNQTIYELADEPDEPVAVEEPEEEQNVTAPEEIISEPEEERGFAFVGEKTVEEPIAEAYDIQNLDEHYAENAVENDFGIQPDDIDHFYREPDYDDEETIEMPAYASANEENDFEKVPSVSQVETVDHASFQDTQKFPEEIEPEKEEIFEPETESSDADETATEKSFSETDVPDEIKAESENLAVESEGENLSVETEVEKESTQVLSSAPILDFDELDLLELSFPENRPTSFADVSTENQIASVEEIPNLQETIEVQDEQVKSQVAEQLSGVNLSAADIEAIADKVVEKLTARLKE